jgi:quercetin dioxygenase-like cupin family protein
LPRISADCRPGEGDPIREVELNFHSAGFMDHHFRVLLVAGLLGLGSAVCAQTSEKSSGVNEALVISQVLPDDSGRNLTAVVVELAPGAKAGSHHHAGIVFAYVLEGAVRSQLDDGELIEYRIGHYWVEPPGARHTLTQNSSQTMPARILAVFVAPTAARLTTSDK